jgi:P4 family phage/plasmid primase-like protien
MKRKSGTFKEFKKKLEKKKDRSSKCFKDAYLFLGLLAQKNGIITLQTFDDQSTQRRELCRVDHMKIGDFEHQWEELWRLNEAGAGIFAMINAGDGKGRAKDNVVQVSALFADLDGAPLKPVLEVAAKPHLIVKSSPGRYHAYWFVKNVLLDQFKPFQKAIAARFCGDHKVCDLPRVMRIPGFYHRKDKPYLTHIVERNRVPKYTIEQLIQGLVLEPYLEPKTPKGFGELNPKAFLGGDKQATWRRLEKALSFIPADDREDWLQVGMAIHDFDSSPHGYDVWTQWSQTSVKFNADDQINTWQSFKPNGGITLGTVFHRAQERGWKCTEKKREYRLTDVGNAERLADTASSSIQYVIETEQFRACRDGLWCSDSSAIVQAAKRVTEEMLREAEKCESEHERVAQKNHALSSQSQVRMQAMISLCKNDPSMRRSLSDFDSNPWLLGVKGGRIIDLRTAEYRKAQPEDFISLCANAEYREDADCPQFLKFLDQITCGDTEMARFIQEYLGYCLTGCTDEQKLMFWVGSGANGKSVLQAVVGNILGAYACPARPETFMAHRFASLGPNPELIALKGKRLVFVPEVGQHQCLNATLLKEVTGEDAISARPLYKDPIQYKPNFKLVFIGNSKPQAPAEDSALWRRLTLVPFNAKFKREQQDKKLKDKLLTEASGILNWMIAGCVAWRERGLLVPSSINQAAKQYRREVDTVQRWIEAACEISASCVSGGSDLYESYTKWCSRHGDTAINHTAFGQEMSRKFQKHRARAGVFYKGISLKPEKNRL